MSCDTQSFLTRTATPTFTWFNGQASHWTSAELARESVLEIFASPAEPPWKNRRRVAFISCPPLSNKFHSRGWFTSVAGNLLFNLRRFSGCLIRGILRWGGRKDMDARRSAVSQLRG